MSFGRSTPGKDIWGTTTYKIHLVPTSSKFDESFSGTLTLYERRWEKSKAEFHGLTQFVTTLKEFWGESLQRGNIQETRLARWIEEYLNQINIAVDYESALQAVKGESVGVTIDSISDRVNKELLTDFLRNDEEVESSEAENYVKALDDVIPSVYRIQLDDKINMVSNANEFLSAFLEKHKPDRATQILSSASFMDETGKIRTIEKKVQIEDSPTTGNSKMSGGLVNSFSFPISNVEIEDKIPFEFTIEDIELSDNSIEKIGEELNKEGIFVKWKIPRLEPNMAVNIDYYLGNRITRTIVSHTEESVTLINTYEPIVKQQNGLYADGLFVNETSDLIENMKIVDQIPKELDLISSTPILDGKNHLEESENVNEVHWLHEKVLPNTEIQVHYDLKERPYLLRDIYEISTVEGQPVAQISKVVKQLKLQFGFGVILALRTLRETDETIIIQDHLPEDIEVSSVLTENGSIVIGVKENNKVVEWTITPNAKGRIYQAFLRYKPKEKFENTKLVVKIGEKESRPTGEFSSSRSEQSVVLPYQYNKFVDIRS